MYKCVLLFVALISLFVISCSDDNLVDGDFDSDNTELNDGDASEVDDSEKVVDGDISEIELEVELEAESETSEEALEVEAELELEVEIEFEAEAENDVEYLEAIEREGELEEYESIQLTSAKFPFDDVTVVPCIREGQSVPFVSMYNIWEDSIGDIYFGGLAGFWFYESKTKTLTCDNTIKEQVFAIEGRDKAGKTEIWVLFKDKMGLFVDAKWDFYSIPSPDTTLKNRSEETPIFTGNLHINGDNIIAIISYLIDDSNVMKLAKFSIHDKEWQIIDACPGMRPVLNNYGYWHDNKFYVTGENRLYFLTLDNFTCQQAAQFDDGSSGNLYRLFGEENGTFWISRHLTDENEGKLFNLFRMASIYSYNVSHNELFFEKSLPNNPKNSSLYSTIPDFLEKPFFLLEFSAPPNVHISQYLVKTYLSVGDERIPFSQTGQVVEAGRIKLFSQAFLSRQQETDAILKQKYAWVSSFYEHVQYITWE